MSAVVQDGDLLLEQLHGPLVDAAVLANLHCHILSSDHAAIYLHMTHHNLLMTMTEAWLDSGSITSSACMMTAGCLMSSKLFSIASRTVPKAPAPTRQSLPFGREQKEIWYGLMTHAGKSPSAASGSLQACSTLQMSAALSAWTTCEDVHQ